LEIKLVVMLTPVQRK